MSNVRISMSKIREIIRLREESKLSNRQIAQALNISRPVVSHYLADYKASGLSHEKVKEMNDDELMDIFENKRKGESEKYRKLSEKFEYYAKELKRSGVTLDRLWQEYKEANPDGYGRSQFCHHYRVWRDSSEITMHIEHKAGEKMFVDYPGKKLMVYERLTDTGREERDDGGDTWSKPTDIRRSYRESEESRLDKSERECTAVLRRSYSSNSAGLPEVSGRESR